MSSIIKSRFTGDQQQREKTIEIRRFVTQPEIEPEIRMQEQLQQQAEQLMREAEAQAKMMEQQAQTMLMEAKNQLEAERQQWEAEKQRIADEARKQGYEEGFRTGNEAGLATYDSMLAEVRAMIDMTKRDYYSYIEASEEVILQLGVQIAEKIIGEQLTENPEKLLSLIRTAIKEVREHKEIHLFVSASSYPFVHDHKEELMMLLNGETNLFIYPDSEIADTSCIIESSFGRIDASVDSQLDEIKKRLTELLKEDAHES